MYTSEYLQSLALMTHSNSTCLINHLDHDEYIKLHQHHIEYMINAQTCPVSLTWVSARSPGQPYMTHTPTPANNIQDVL